MFNWQILKAFIELDDDEDNDKPDLYKEIIKRFHVDRLTWKDLFNDFEMHFYRYVFPYYDTLYTLEKLSQKAFKLVLSQMVNLRLNNSDYIHLV